MEDTSLATGRQPDRQTGREGDACRRRGRGGGTATFVAA